MNDIISLLEKSIDPDTQKYLERNYGLTWFFELRKKWASDGNGVGRETC